MSDISRKVFSIEPEPDEEPIAIVPEPVELDATTELDLSKAIEPRPEPSESDGAAFVSRPIIELVENIEASTPVDLPDDRTKTIDIPNVPLTPVRRIVNRTSEPVRSISEIIPVRPVIPESKTDIQPLDIDFSPSRLGWIGPLAVLLTGLAIGLLVYAYITEAGRVSAVGLAGLILATLIPMLGVAGLWTVLRATSSMRAESLRLANVAHRLTRVDDTVVADVRTMSDAIRRELTQVDAKLVQSRAELENLAQQVKSHSDSLISLSETMATRATQIEQASEEQKTAFADLSKDFEDRLTDLTSKLNKERGKLQTATDTATDRVTTATASIGHATQLTEDHAEALEKAAASTNEIVTKAEARLSALSRQIAEQSNTLEVVFEERIKRMAELSERLSSEKPIAEQALQNQVKSLGALDAQIEMTEERLSDLLEHARQVQDALSSRLDDIDNTLGDADSRSRAFTADIADRVSDSVAQTRREMSLMESDLRALQSRMDSAANNAADAPDLLISPDDRDATSNPNSPGPLHLMPLDTDFPSLDADELSIPEVETDPLDLTEIVETGNLTSDIVRRPGSETGPLSKTFGRRSDDHRDKDWQWRDMLGSIDATREQTALPSHLNEDGKPPTRPGTSIQRPGPGIPLSAPAPKPQPPEGSEVVARLCEVELPPSTVVDDATIKAAEKARRKAGETGQSSAVFSRLNAPILHLRGVLSADLEFRLRAEGFRRDFNGYLSTVENADQVKADLSSASGRAYLLCAAALSPS